VGRGLLDDLLGRFDREALPMNRGPLEGLHPQVVHATLETDACPVQVTGQLTDGRHFYFRYRSGLARLGLGTTPQRAVIDSYFADTIRHGDHLDGSLRREEVMALFDELLKIYTDGDGRS
jgi:hypothetical protein